MEPSKTSTKLNLVKTFKVRSALQRFATNAKNFSASFKIPKDSKAVKFASSPTKELKVI